MQYNAALRECPNCGSRRPHALRRVIAWRWPLPLAIGLAVQILSQRVGPERGHALRQGVPRVAQASQFLAGMLVFAGLAALLLFLAGSVFIALRRSVQRRRRRQARRRSF